MDMLTQLGDKLLRKVFKELAVVNNFLIDVNFDFDLKSLCKGFEKSAFFLVLLCVMVIVQVFLYVFLNV